MKTEFLAKVVMQDGCVSVTFDGLGGTLSFPIIFSYAGRTGKWPALLMCRPTVA